MNVLPTNVETALDPAGLFDAIDLKGLKSVIVAVSGGSDSLALLYLLIAYHASRPSPPEIIAVTIDHGLRPESAGEARYVAALCKEAGISHRILNWSGPKPYTGISAKARDVRYTLLCEAARDAGTDVILTGHTLDDQIETYVMRSARVGEEGSDRGLAGMAPATLLDREIWLVRPLLATSRASLRDYLRAKAIAWCDDPSNDDPKYERVRVRKALKGDDRENVSKVIDEKVGQRRLVNANTAQMLRHCVAICDGVRAELRREIWAAQDADSQYLGIGVLLATIGGLSFLPSAENCRKALHHIFEHQPSGRITLSRCVVQLKRDKVLIYREMRSLPELTIAPNETAIWDGRYRICNHCNRPLNVAAGGTEGLRFLEERGYPNFNRASTLSSPALLSDGVVIGMPAAIDHAKLPEGVAVDRYLALFDHILSGYDEILAQSVADIFQVQAYPVNQINKN
ncbi:MAG: tRNA lysidine(34) synthetase TilS [Phyllobacterium sp.]|uniref:tRNA lysidine(34) synthetase TilS n=1 Tax=Phyllobacterium sp. TaxID=1871046 RepID=UPI0030F34872